MAMDQWSWFQIVVFLLIWLIMILVAAVLIAVRNKKRSKETEPRHLPGSEKQSIEQKENIK
ncbi:hypothetical protein [Bacillus sp. 1P06AnD]|uniref:hypothetical protein n=1 Tax=Bacillus sp. 1P06AnD TaxID=3132208 RepID=UPI0039A3A3D7